MKTVAELETIRKEAYTKVKLRSEKAQVRVVICMATCGIAAGARSVMMALVEEINNRELNNIVVTQSGCMGACQLEPMMEVYCEGEKTTYVKVTPDDAKKIVAEHIVSGQVVKECTMEVYEQ